MKSFLKNKIESISFSPITAWFLSQCTEARGMQEMWKTMRPEILANLRESAIIQSTESSNRIEGVEVDRARLSPLVLGMTKPVDRSEEEIVGYRRALDYIHRNYQKVEITATLIRKLHELAQGGMIGDAGRWKERNNEIIEFQPGGERIVRFSPVSPHDVPHFMEQLCLGYRDVVNNNVLPDLIAIANFVFDFLCIHPFRDGNGRVSRLLTLLLLYRQGYEVGRYISLERIIEETKQTYYEVLKKSSEGWFDAEHDLMPRWQYFLSTVKSSYQELKTRVESSPTGDTMSSLVRQTLESFTSTFSITDLCRIHPNIDRDLIKKVINSAKNDGVIEPLGKGRNARWQPLIKRDE